VRVWDLATNTLPFFYRDPNGYLMTCITWSPDSKFIAFGNDDNGTRDVKSRKSQRLAPLPLSKKARVFGS
jgi:WD40 repeat protein